jgi:hypothetical protein
MDEFYRMTARLNREGHGDRALSYLRKAALLHNGLQSLDSRRD